MTAPNPEITSRPKTSRRPRPRPLGPLSPSGPFPSPAPASDPSPTPEPSPKWDSLTIRRRLEHMRSIREFALKVVQEGDDSRVNEAALQIAASQIYELLAGFDPATLKAQLVDDPENYTRLINALFKLSDGGLKYERYRAEVAERKAAMEKTIAAAKGENVITRETIEKIERELNLF